MTVLNVLWKVFYQFISLKEMSSIRTLRLHQRTLSCKRTSTLLQDPRLLGDISKSTNDFLVAFVKAQDSVRDIHILAKLLDELLRLAEVVARNAGKQMVDRLELESTMEKVQPDRTVHIHGRPEHLLGEAFKRAKISC